MDELDTNLQWINFATHITFEAQESYVNLTECDVKFVVGDQHMVAHKIILSTASDFFKDILLSVPEYEIATILIPNIDFGLLKYAVDFIYTGEAEIPSKSIDEFIEICNFLGLKSIAHESLKMFENCETIVTEDIMEYDESSFISAYEINDGSSYGEITVNDMEGNMINDEKFSGVKSKKLKQKLKRPKKYLDNGKLQCAIKDVESGKTFREVAKTYQIPLSSLYAYTKQKKNNIKRNGRPSLYDKFRLQKAVESILQDHMSYKKAEETFGIPKTILWRNVKKLPKPIDTPKNPRNEHKLKAIQALENGECLVDVCKKYNIAISTLYREKRKLSINGKIPITSSMKIYKRGEDFKSQVKLAVEACQKGLSQGIASVLYNVPKTTIWRHLKKFQTNEDSGETNQDLCNK